MIIKYLQQICLPDCQNVKLHFDLYCKKGIKGYTLHAIMIKEWRDLAIIYICCVAMGSIDK